MSVEQETRVRATCDGCAAMVENGPELTRRWRRLVVELQTVPDGGPLRRTVLDLCPSCIGRVVVPGLEEAAARQSPSIGAVA